MPIAYKVFSLENKPIVKRQKKLGQKKPDIKVLYVRLLCF